MIIVNKDQHSQLLTDNLKTLNVSVREEVNSISRFTEDDKTPPTPSDIILYFQHDDIQKNSDDFSTLAKAYPKTPRILIQTTASPKIEVADHIDAQVVMPLLGESFLKKLTNIAKSYEEPAIQETATEEQEVVKKRILIAEDIKNCYDSGMNEYLSKPLKKELLKEKLAKHIG